MQAPVIFRAVTTRSASSPGSGALRPLVLALACWLSLPTSADAQQVSNLRVRSLGERPETSAAETVHPRRHESAGRPTLLKVVGHETPPARSEAGPASRRASRGQSDPAVRQAVHLAEPRPPMLRPTPHRPARIDRRIAANQPGLLPAPAQVADQPPATPEPEHLIPVVQPDEPAKLSVRNEDDRVSLTVRDASLRQVVALIAETQKLNIVFATPAETTVTASFDRLPWQQVLDSLLSASGHTWTVNGEVIFISSLQQADQIPPGAGGRETRVFELDFMSAVDVDQAVQGLVSPAGSSWVLETSPSDNRRTREAVVVNDYPANLLQIESYIAQVDLPPRQVLIEANILQVDLQDDCRSGVDFTALSRFSGNQIKFRPVGMANDSASPAFFLEVTGTALNGLVELLKSTTDAKTLASPKLLALNGQLAHIQIGEQLGYRVTTTTQTSSLESVQFLDVGVVLTVTPRITRDGRVLMRIKPKVSTGDVSPETGLPAEKTTEVETDVIVESGRGVVIGGLIQERDNNIQSKIPWLGDLPYAGVLFQRRQLVKARTEIIVTLVPHVQPYGPDIQCREDQEFLRTQDRLTTGPLCRAPRPYEPQLPDTFDNPKLGFRTPECRQVARANRPRTVHAGPAPMVAENASPDAGQLAAAARRPGAGRTAETRQTPQGEQKQSFLQACRRLGTSRGGEQTDAESTEYPARIKRAY